MCTSLNMACSAMLAKSTFFIRVIDYDLRIHAVYDLQSFPAPADNFTYFKRIDRNRTNSECVTRCHCGAFMILGLGAEGYRNGFQKTKETFDLVAQGESESEE